jgi:hypothetical protein
MKHKRLKSTLLFVGTAIAGLLAQESRPASGGNALGSGGTASYSVGQIVYSTNTGTNGSASEGVHQPYEIWIVTELEDAKDITLSISAYPNPTTDFLILEVKNKELLKLDFQLYDIYGKLLQSKKITSNQTSISMGNLIPSTYFVKIIQNNIEIKIFKIIKKQGGNRQ